MTRSGLSVLEFEELRARYNTYRQCLRVLGADHQTVAARKAAIIGKDRFESDVRAGLFDAVFAGAVSVQTCQCGVPLCVSHYCSSLDHCWIGQPILSPTSANAVRKDAP